MIRAAHRFAIAAACTAAALPVAVAGATPPTVEVIPFDETEVVAPGEALGFGTNPCPFTVTLHHHQPQGLPALVRGEPLLAR